MHICIHACVNTCSPSVVLDPRMLIPEAQASLPPSSTFIRKATLGGSLGNCLSSLMVPVEVPIHKYFSGPRNYHPAQDFKEA